MPREKCKCTFAEKKRKKRSFPHRKNVNVHSHAGEMSKKSVNVHFFKAEMSCKCTFTPPKNVMYISVSLFFTFSRMITSFAFLSEKNDNIIRTKSE